MEYRSMGRSGLSVSLAGMGCNTLGWWVDAAQGARVVHAGLDAGVTLFDTADLYDDGTSETILGQALGARRRDVTIVTKFGMKMSSTPEHRQRGSREHIIRCCEDSLRRLGTDWIDLYLHHQPDAATPVEETLEALDRLIGAGKIRYAGCSNYAGWQIADAAWTSRERRLNPFVAAQNEWNLLSRGVETEVVPAARRFGLGLMPYFPLAMGLLTGKYVRGGERDPAMRLGGEDPRYAAMLSDAQFDRVEKLAAFARERGRGLLEVAIGWLASRDVVATVICGATRPDQIRANAAAVVAWRPDADDEAALDRLSAA